MRFDQEDNGSVFSGVGGVVGSSLELAAMLQERKRVVVPWVRSVHEKGFVHKDRIRETKPGSGRSLLPQPSFVQQGSGSMSSIFGVCSRRQAQASTATAPLQEDATARGLFDASRGRRERKGKKRNQETVSAE